MSTWSDDDNALFDRLVDGELSPEEYRELLSSLGDRPDGWRRCALAFLEAQGWAKEIRSVRRDWEFAGPEAEEKSTPVVLRQANSDRRGKRWRRVVGLAATMAASFGLALSLGLVVRDAQMQARRETDDGAPQIAETGPVVEKTIPANDAAPPSAELDPWGQYVFAVNDGGPEREVQLPVYDGSKLDEQEFADWLDRQAQANRPEWLEALRRAGHDVRTRPALAPIDLQNGQQALVPALEVEIVPVKRTYQ